MRERIAVGEAAGSAAVSLIGWKTCRGIARGDAPQGTNRRLQAPRTAFASSAMATGNRLTGTQRGEHPARGDQLPVIPPPSRRNGSCVAWARESLSEFFTPVTYRRGGFGWRASAANSASACGPSQLRLRSSVVDTDFRHAGLPITVGFFYSYSVESQIRTILVSL